MTRLNTPFYLTGGTAINRYYCRCRYSDDLDLFVNNDPLYGQYITSIFRELEKLQKQNYFIIDYPRIRKSEFFTQFFLIKKQNNAEIELKIDLVNDIAPHYGEIEFDEILGKIDSFRNILSNKIAAVFRYEAKDFVDIWSISKKYKFNWQEILEEAKNKEGAVDPIAIYEIMYSFPSNLVSSIKWSKEIDKDKFINDLKTIASEIFNGEYNSLAI